jgi:hypothetical protein
VLWKLTGSKPLLPSIPSVSILFVIQGKYTPLWCFLKPTGFREMTILLDLLSAGLVLNPVEKGRK